MRRMIPLVLLTACGGNFVDNSPRCSHDVFDWFGGLVHHLDQGDGFAFNYVPPEVNVARINGGYITENENTDFYWYKTYTDGYFLEKSTIQGIGTAYSSGDLDVLYVEDVVDSLEEEWRVVVREERGGCDGRRSVMYGDQGDIDWADIQAGIGDDASETVYTIMSSDRVEFTETYEPSKSISRVRVGAWSSDRSTQYSETWQNGNSEGSSEVSISPEGTSTEDFWELYSDSDLERIGTSLTKFDGSVHSEYTQGEPGKEPEWEIVSDVNYDGSGLAVWTYNDGTVCDLVFKANGNCTYTCDNGQDGDC